MPRPSARTDSREDFTEPLDICGKDRHGLALIYEWQSITVSGAYSPTNSCSLPQSAPRNMGFRAGPDSDNSRLPGIGKVRRTEYLVPVSGERFQMCCACVGCFQSKKL